MPEPPITSPILAKWRLANDAFDIRKQLDLSQQQFARQIGATSSMVGMVETRERIPNEKYLRGMLQVCGRLSELTYYTELESTARSRVPELRGINDGSSFAPGFDEFVGLERPAQRIDIYETRVIPGLLQTRDYAWESLQATRSHADINRKFQIRTYRQEIMKRPVTPLVLAILEEQVLDRPVGSPEVMRAQLDHLLSLPERSHGRVTIQVCPTSAGPHSNLVSSFNLLRFESPRDPGIAATENQVRMTLHERPAEIQQFLYELDHLRMISLPPDDSAALIERKRKEVC